MGQGADRRAAIEHLVRRTLGVEITRLEDLAPGLGSRRFTRVHLARGTPRSLIARMEAPEDASLRPPSQAAEPGLEPLRSFLEEGGIPVPARYGSDTVAGIDLLEDAGDVSLESAAAGLPDAERRSLYTEACTLIPRLQRLVASRRAIPAFERRLGPSLFAHKAERFIEWGLPLGLERPASPGEADAVRAAFELVAEESSAAPQRLAHRDYKAANIHLRLEQAPGRRLVLIDLQGAFLAPPEYDLVCLLRDGHVPLEESEVNAHLERVRPELPDRPDAEEYARRFSLLTLTRVGKDLALYRYAAAVRDDRRYLAFVPNCVRYLQQAAERAAEWDPRLARLAELIAALPRANAPQEGSTTCER